MPRKSDIPPERFNDLLAWLDPNPESAGLTYLDLQDSLARIFAWRKCADPEGMADEVFDRVCRRLPQLEREFEGNPKVYCYAVANNLIKEYQKKLKLNVPFDGIDVADEPPDTEDTSIEFREECLNDCLQKLPERKRELILSYYSKEKHAKIVHRAEMARQLGISVETLRVRMSRMRRNLEACIELCLDRRRNQK
ncbi:MAG TPA: sigma-70 family RNA polymerase sigma factor [Pyrinomonadaceae bacterium]|nr:sigma-70 family RNA polymerase sigma factor [Pyrinomonadaceae bacterium]